MTEKSLYKEKKTRSRFQFLSWPLSIYDESKELHQDDYRIQGKTYKKPRYPIRAMTYWWVSCVIKEELERLHRPLVIADIGCERGLLKRFVPPWEECRWIGLDLREDELMPLAHYHEFHEFDFNQPLPIEDNSVDIVAFLNVLEHLPRPEFAMTELRRILRPGGMALIAHPIYPKLIARIREKQYANEFKKGNRHYGEHTAAFWPERSRHLAVQSGFDVEFMTSTYFLSWSKGPLENYSLWIRFNQLWGALLPSLGQELCMQLRLNS